LILEVSEVKTMTIPLMEDFLTIQGEGFHQGKAAYFIRLAGCDVGCHWCDVKESWNKNDHPEIPIESVIKRVVECNVSMVVITGGEPLMYDLDILTGHLKYHQLETHLETSGAHPLSGQWDWVCFSPKKFKSPFKQFYNISNELKVVIYNKHDFEWAEAHAKQMHDNCYLSLQPEWSVMDKITPQIVEYIKSNPKWRLSLQTHKFINVP